jgi:hypothetical protein
VTDSFPPPEETLQVHSTQDLGVKAPDVKFLILQRPQRREQLRLDLPLPPTSLLHGRWPKHQKLYDSQHGSATRVSNNKCHDSVGYSRLLELNFYCYCISDLS